MACHRVGDEASSSQIMTTLTDASMQQMASMISIVESNCGDLYCYVTHEWNKMHRYKGITVLAQEVTLTLIRVRGAYACISFYLVW